MAINVMEAIWESSQKDEEGNLLFPPGLADFLYEHGFIDTATCTPDDWRKAFVAFVPVEGLYHITHDEFLTLEKYRYKGEVKYPFDPARINEGKYTDEGFEKLSAASIAPSCGLPTADFRQFIDGLKSEFRQDDDLILIKAPAKQKIKKVLDEQPSPLRRLELILDATLKSDKKLQELAQLEQQVRITATPEQQAEAQKSVFRLGAQSIAHAMLQELQKIEKAAAKGGPLPEAGGEKGEPLKKIKRSKKGLRG